MQCACAVLSSVATPALPRVSMLHHNGTTFGKMLSDMRLFVLILSVLILSVLILSVLILFVLILSVLILFVLILSVLISSTSSV